MPVPPGHPNSVQGPYLLSCVRHGSAHGLVGQRHRALALRAGAWLLWRGPTERWMVLSVIYADTDLLARY